MKVVLKQDVKSIGKKDELHEVSDGYARNYLLPRGLAVAADAAAVGVLEQDISFGGTGTVYANVLASLARAGIARPSANFIGGLGGDDISREAVRGAFARLEALAAGEGASGEVVFLGIEEGEEDQR